jgi:hypothetical protein
MAVFVQMQAPEGLGGQIRGEWGHYQQDENGVFTVDSRDALNLLSLGLTVVPPPAPTGSISNARPTVSHPAAAAAAVTGKNH